MLNSLLRSPFGVAAFLLPLVALFQNKLITVLLIVLAAAVVVLARARLRHWGVWLPLMAGLGLLLLWALLSASWSIDPAHSLARFARLAPTVAIGLLLCAAAAAIADADRRTVVLGLALGLTVASVIALAGEIAFWFTDPEAPQSEIRQALRAPRYRPFSSVAGLMLFPLAALALGRGQGWIRYGAVPVAAAAVFVAGSYSAMMAMVAGALAFALTARYGASAVRVMAVLLPLAFLTLPAAVTALDVPALARAHGGVLHHSAAHRLMVWRFVDARIAERPYLGWGLHTARLIPGGDGDGRKDPAYRDIAELMRVKKDVKAQLLPLHPHSATLQLRLELGLPGVLLYAALYALCCLALLRRFAARPALAAGAAVLAAAFVTGQLSFSVWQSWWLSAQFCAAALLLAVCPAGGGGTAVGDMPRDTS